MWRHVRNCRHATSPNSTEPEDNSSSTIAQARMLLDGASLNTSERVWRVIVSSMRERGDERTVDAVKKDPLILRFGAMLLERRGAARKNEIGQRMRQLGRLVVKSSEVACRKLSLDECIGGRYFDTVVEATRLLCKPQEDQTMSGVTLTKSPSLGIHIGHSIIKCCQIKRGQCIRLGDTRKKQDADNFKELFEAEWTDLIASPAHQALKERVSFSAQDLPSTADLQRLLAFTEKAIVDGTAKLHTSSSSTDWRKLANTIFVACTVFNKRRGGEVARIRTKSFSTRQTKDDRIHKDLKESLSPVEQKLMER
eukprot:XP_011664588.1 PREDICTED: uncharacterized protein LOC100888406 [Strongylocentrotus purpuratus]